MDPAFHTVDDDDNYLINQNKRGSGMFRTDYFRICRATMPERRDDNFASPCVGR
jgi:hypothetical protein